MTLRSSQHRLTTSRRSRSRKPFFERLEKRVLFAADATFGSYMIPAGDVPQSEQSEEIFHGLGRDSSLTQVCDPVRAELPPPGAELPPEDPCGQIDGEKADPEQPDVEDFVELKVSEPGSASTDAKPTGDQTEGQEVGVTAPPGNQFGGQLINPIAYGSSAAASLSQSPPAPSTQTSAPQTRPFHYFAATSSQSGAGERTLSRRPATADLQHDSFMAMTIMTPRSLQALESPQRDPHPMHDDSDRDNGRVAVGAAKHARASKTPSDGVDEVFQQWDMTAEIDGRLAHSQTGMLECLPTAPPEQSPVSIDASSAMLEAAEKTPVADDVSSDPNRVPAKVSLAALVFFSTFVSSRDRRWPRPSPPTLRTWQRIRRWIAVLQESAGRLRRAYFAIGNSSSS